MTASEAAVLGAVIVSAMGAVFGLYQARKADRSATTTRTIEIGVKDLVDQYQEANKDLREQVQELLNKHKEQDAEIRELKNMVHELKLINEQLITELDNKNSDIIRLKNLAGEPLDGQ